MILITVKFAPSSLNLLAKNLDRVLDLSVEVSSSRVSSSVLFVGASVTVAMVGTLIRRLYSLKKCKGRIGVTANSFLSTTCALFIAS